MATTPVTESSREQVMSGGTHREQGAVAARQQQAGAPLRRAHAAAWFTFIFMAGTTMTFQTYHSVETGQMPWPLAALYGVGAFALAITVLEFARHSPSNWVKAGAYALTGGAMYLSASATGDVTQHAAPQHAQLLFGLLMDGAALLAIHFIMNGPTAGHAVAAVVRREAELIAQADAERSAREQDADAHRSAADSLRAELGSQRTAFDRALSEARGALETARSEAETATARAEVLAAKLAAPAGRSRTGTGRRGTASRTASGTAPKDDLDLEARALKLLAANLDMSGAELAEKLGVSAGYGRKLRRRLTGNGPSEAPADRSGTALEDRDGDRA
jgi:hypothetical protein